MLLEGRMAEDCLLAISCVTADCTARLHLHHMQNKLFFFYSTPPPTFFKSVFCNHLQLFSIWMLWTLLFALWHNLKWINNCFTLYPIYFSCSLAHMATPHLVWQPLQLLYLSTSKFRLLLSLPKFVEKKKNIYDFLK